MEAEISFKTLEKMVPDYVLCDISKYTNLYFIRTK